MPAYAQLVTHRVSSCITAVATMKPSITIINAGTEAFATTTTAAAANMEVKVSSISTANNVETKAAVGNAVKVEVTNAPGDVETKPVATTVSAMTAVVTSIAVMVVATSFTDGTNKLLPPPLSQWPLLTQ